MALLDNVVKQRMVGALVLIAIAVIFLPMLFTREDETRQVQVEALRLLTHLPRHRSRSILCRFRSLRFCLRSLCRVTPTWVATISHPPCRLHRPRLLRPRLLRLRLLQQSLRPSR